MKIKIFADGADQTLMLKRYREGNVAGFTTNPSLMVKAGVKDYEGFARSVLSEIKDVSISFEVFSDDFPEMERQALKIASWGSNVAVKIPIMNTRSESAVPLIRRLFEKNLKLNVTAIFTEEQLKELHSAVRPQDDVIVSVFAGRIADTGVDPVPLMKKSVEMFSDRPGSKVLWASSREPLNVYQAEQCGCHIITVTDDILGKLKLCGKSPLEMSLDTVKTFYKDSTAAGFKL